MTLDKIAVTELKVTGGIIRRLMARVKLTAHCSCGEDFGFKRKFPAEPSETYFESAICPACKTATRLQHNVEFAINWTPGTVNVRYVPICLPKGVESLPYRRIYCETYPNPGDSYNSQATEVFWHHF